MKFEFKYVCLQCGFMTVGIRVTDNNTQCPICHNAYTKLNSKDGKKLINMSPTQKDKWVENQIGHPIPNDLYVQREQYKKNKLLEIQQAKAQSKKNEAEDLRRTYNQQSPLKCPKCNSTSVSTTARGVNGFWGFIGASKTVNRCGNCGYTWKPNGR
jgi:hypothetical protein